MSQQGSPRKSNPGRSTTESDRMPFAAAEALLWGKEIKRNLEFIVPQMKELQRQHEAYDARIQAAEITAEAAEAATARVQRIEQKLVAMEEDDTDRPFDKWVGEEITQLKMFADRNKDVRTKLTELENRFLNATDSLDTARDMSKDLRSVFRHLDDLEIDRRGQSNRIKAMEKEILDLRMLCHGYAARDKELQRVVGRPDTLSKTIVWPREVQLHDNRSRRSSRASPRSKKAASQKRRMTAESETEDEDLNSPGRGRIQVPRSSSITSNSDAVLVSSSPSKGRQAKSARLNMMRRPSIYDARIPRAGEQEQVGARPLQPKPRSHVNKLLPETQLVGNANLGKRKRPLEATPSQRVLRTRHQPGESSLQQHVVPASKENIHDSEVEVMNTTAERKRRAGVPPAQQQANPPVDRGQNSQPQPSVTKSKKSVPRKAPVAPKSRSNRPPGTCLACRQRKQKCDRGRPACSQCTKRSIQCAYDRPPGEDTQLVVPTQPVVLKRQAPQSNTNMGHAMSLATRQPHIAPSFTPNPSAAGPSTTSGPFGLPGPTSGVPDLQTFLEMQAKGQVI